MAEEQRLQGPAGGHRLCSNNCGFFGSPTTHNLCSKCYKDHCMKEEQMKEAKLMMETTLTKQSHESESSKFLESEEQFEEKKLENVVVEEQDKAPRVVVVAELVGPNRCTTCHKRVGLTGFKCRCGATFCGTHRYPEQHGCMFDYKAMGKEEIIKANPIVIAKKLDKI